ncbi:MAG TPA: six-cysteine peptide SCIFF [Clostridiales bacterium]|nr:MAG: six-cysteine peptide SCIFF [Clostridiales bacterium GWD2_32_59]HAN09724.1 six-cysteine peptide SCIFF [Clostridiales bacterium]
MKHVDTIYKGKMNKKRSDQGCGKCQTACNSACKTSLTVAQVFCVGDGNQNNNDMNDLDNEKPTFNLAEETQSDSITLIDL